LGLHRCPSLKVETPRLRLDEVTWGAWAFRLASLDQAHPSMLGKDASLREIRLARRVQQRLAFGSIGFTRPGEAGSLVLPSHPARACPRVSR